MDLVIMTVKLSVSAIWKEDKIAPSNAQARLGANTMNCNPPIDARTSSNTRSLNILIKTHSNTDSDTSAPIVQQMTFAEDGSGDTALAGNIRNAFQSQSTGATSVEAPTQGRTEPDGNETSAADDRRSPMPSGKQSPILVKF